jgi:DNA-binding SARP family transcriptional activator
VDAKLEIKTLGGFRVSYKDKSIGTSKSKGNAKKMWMLFEYLLLNHDRTVSQEELIDVLWHDTEVTNPLNSLKVLVFKLRKEIDTLGFVPGKEVILNAHGTYSFNESVPFEVDIMVFEKLIKEADSEKLTEDQRLEILYKALDCFKGNVLSMTPSSTWSVALQTQYATMYRDAIEKTQTILADRGEYQQIVEICNAALLRQPYEESYYYYLITAYAAMEEYDSASRMYAKVKEMMQAEYGATPGVEFETAYKELMKDRPNRNVTPEELVSEMEEKIDYVSSFMVEFGEFRQIFRLTARRLGRDYNDARLSVYSLGVHKGANVTKKEKEENMRILQNAISFMLRQADVFTRSGPTQFSVLFTDVTEENAIMIADRISKYFEGHRTNNNFGVLHSMAMVESAHVKKAQAKSKK